MLTGLVVREWARHHYGLWYRQQVDDERRAATGGRTRPASVRLHCPACDIEHAVAWEPLLAAIAGLEELRCAECREELWAASAVLPAEDLDRVARVLELAGVGVVHERPSAAGRDAGSGAPPGLRVLPAWPEPAAAPVRDLEADAQAAD
jgi:hypothetical protein